MKKVLKVMVSTILIAGLLSGCAASSGLGVNVSIKKQMSLKTMVPKMDFEYEVIPETFKIAVESNGKKETIAQPMDKRKIANLKENDKEISWTFTDENIDVTVKKESDYLDVNIRSSKKETTSFDWPKIKAEQFTIPLGEGKQFSGDDDYWKQYLDGKEFNGIEALSMQFFAANMESYSALYIIENPYNNQLKFDTKNDIEFTMSHEFPSINENKEYGFRIYILDNDIVDISKTYQDYIIEKGKFKTLKEKEEENPNISKLYGAPHIYYYPTSIIDSNNIKWNLLKNDMSPELTNHIKKLLSEYVEDGEQKAVIFDDIKNENAIYKYHQSQIVIAFNDVLQLKEFYNKDIFKSLNQVSTSFLEKGIDNLNKSEVIELNKNLLYNEIKNAVEPIAKWANSNTVDILNDMNKSGINKAWIGLDDWTKGLYKPEFVSRANEMGYLIGTYDSYHSIHKPGDEKWITAQFSDMTLYDNAIVVNEKGEPYEGFQGEGRKLNPTLSMPSVKERVNEIMDTGLKYNSWFIDCDATGEIYDDYSKEHETTQEQDLNARLERMAYIRDNKNMVIGSEGGNDFANETVAFAHGIETPAFSWMDKDMSKNKDSEYYLGKYYSAYGGVPEVFSKKVPLKDFYYQIFISPKYSVPLYKLVYNNSVITTHQWGWPTDKVITGGEDRMLKEILYNVPPLYQIDEQIWNQNKELITEHSKVFSKFGEKAVQQEMTDFQILSTDKLVQLSQYGEDLKVVANFSDSDFDYKGDNIKSKSLMIYDKGEKTEYIPRID